MITLLLQLLRLLPFLCSGHRQLALENLALHQQLAVYKRTVPRPKLRTTDRLFWVALARAWAGWRQPLVIVTPDTILRWQRRRFREHWTKLSGRPTRGRPAVNLEIAALVTRMAAANPLWGAPRIHGELLKLGFHVAERTVSRLIPKRRTPPSQTWRTFLTNHVPDLVSLDFFTVPTARLRVLFVFVVLAHDRRRVLHFNVTQHPSATWTAQQIVDAFPDDSAPSYLLRDRDSIYGHAFRQRVKGMGISEVLTAPHSPWQNPFAERLIGSIRRESESRPRPRRTAPPPYPDGLLRVLGLRSSRALGPVRRPSLPSTESVEILAKDRRITRGRRTIIVITNRDYAIVCGGPNGIRTRVFSPPRASVIVEEIWMKLTKRCNLGDLNWFVI
jgi:putative transposase